MQPRLRFQAGDADDPAQALGLGAAASCEGAGTPAPSRRQGLNTTCSATSHPRPLRASSADVDARVTSLDARGKPEAGATEQRDPGRPTRSARAPVRYCKRQSCSKGPRRRSSSRRPLRHSAPPRRKASPASKGRAFPIHTTRQQDDGRAGHTAGCCFRLGGKVGAVVTASGVTRAPRRDAARHRVAHCEVAIARDRVVDGRVARSSSADARAMSLGEQAGDGHARSVWNSRTVGQTWLRQGTAVSGIQSPSQNCCARTSCDESGAPVAGRRASLSTSAAKSDLRTRTRRPIRTAGSCPASIHYLNYRVMRNWCRQSRAGAGQLAPEVRIIRSLLRRR